jgi:hypothetical protein
VACLLSEINVRPHSNLLDFVAVVRSFFRSSCVRVKHSIDLLHSRFIRIFEWCWLLASSTHSAPSLLDGELFLLSIDGTSQALSQDKHARGPRRPLQVFGVSTNYRILSYICGARLCATSVSVAVSVHIFQVLGVVNVSCFLASALRTIAFCVGVHMHRRTICLHAFIPHRSVRAWHLCELDSPHPALSLLFSFARW